MLPVSTERWILASGMACLLIAAILVNLILPRYAAIYADSGAALPALAGWLFDLRRALFVLPLSVPLSWWWLTRHLPGDAPPRARRRAAMIALTLGCGLAVLLVPLVIIAMYLAVIHLGDAIGG